MKNKTERQKPAPLAPQRRKSNVKAKPHPDIAKGVDSEPSPAIAAATAGIDQQKLREKAFKWFGSSGVINRHWDFMRELVGEAWEDDLTDIVFQALFVNRKRKHPKPTKDNLLKETVEWLPRDFLTKWMADALNNKDAAFFLRLGKSMEALNKVWPDGIMDAMEPADKWRWTAARFIIKHWNKHGFAPTQQALREHLESMEDYHGQPTPQTGPLPKKTWKKERSRVGIFQHVDRSGGPPKKAIQ